MKLVFFIYSLTLTRIISAWKISQSTRFSMAQLAQNNAHSNSKTNQAKFVAICSVVIGTFLSPVYAAEQSLQDQLKVIQALQVQDQEKSLETQASQVLNKGATYVTGELIARGTVKLIPSGAGSDPSQFPFGLPNAASLDAAFDNDDATLFLTAVGREGPPVAAKKYKLKDLKFPFIFEITTSDLIFPYTPDAWLKSSFSADIMAVTCILDVDGLLVTPSANDRFGFALSNPTALGGVFQRTEAKLDVSLKSDGRPYTPEEAELLGRVDRLAQLNIPGDTIQSPPVTVKR